MSVPHVTEWIPAYALGILPDDEREGVAQHIARCMRCQAELHAYQHVLEELPHTIPQRDPPPGLRARLVRAAQRPLDPVSAPRPSWFAWLLRPMPALAGAIGLVIILALAGVNILLLQQLSHPAPVPTPAASAASFAMVKMTPPQGQASTASGLLVISADGTYGTLVVDGLPMLTKSQQYQIWLIKDGARTSGGVFSVENSGYGMVEIEAPLPLNKYQSFGITIEPFGGSPGPTGAKVLGGAS
jgi:anti-sigma-K factor RskA